jgi:two-component system response regulator AtoC
MSAGAAAVSRFEVEDRRPAGGARGFFPAADPRMLEIKQLARRVAATNAPVLIMGESGVGKEVLARFIHAESRRAARPFVKINCAAVPHDLLESELFGHERGAFTGAYQRKEGKFESANGGTLLLDEIGEMSLPLQAKLLHVLEDPAVTRVGGTQSVRIDARIIATTNKPLEAAVAEREFRQDLYFRLNVMQFELPPLRERRADIPLLCQRFLHTCADGQDAAGARLPDELLAALLDYHWPGNVRELKHVIQRYLILPDVEMVLSELSPPQRAPAPAPAGGTIQLSVDLARLGNGKIHLKSIASDAAEQVEKTVILQVLEQTRWNRRRAASRLDICYKTLLNKLHRWRLDEQDVADDEPPPAVRATARGNGHRRLPPLLAAAGAGGER